MKKVLTATLMIFGLSNSHAATLCQSDSCKGFEGAIFEGGFFEPQNADQSNQVWVAKANNGKEVTGISICSGNEVTPYMPGTPYSSNPSKNGCWCQMIAPCHSRWIFLKRYTDQATCVSECAKGCGMDMYVGGGSTLADALLNNLQ